MSDSIPQALLLELVSNPLMMSNYILYTGNPEDLDSIAKDDPQLAEWIKDLGRIFGSSADTPQEAYGRSGGLPHLPGSHGFGDDELTRHKMGGG